MSVGEQAPPRQPKRVVFAEGKDPPQNAVPAEGKAPLR